MVRATGQPGRPRSRRVELNVRSLGSRTGAGVQDRAIERLRGLDSEGIIESFTVHVWGKRVGLSTTAVETARGQQVLGRIGEFRRWANQSGATLDPFFDSRATTSRVTGEEYTTLRLPTVLMAEYEHGDVVYVTPHESDDGIQRVGDRLDELSESTTEQRVRP